MVKFVYITVTEKGGAKTMSRVIEAVYENGVFRPLEKIDIKEHEKVSLKVVNHEEWRKRFDEITGKIHETTSQFSPEEIEADIDEAVKEVRARKRGHQRQCAIQR